MKWGHWTLRNVQYSGAVEHIFDREALAATAKSCHRLPFSLYLAQVVPVLSCFFHCWLLTYKLLRLVFITCRWARFLFAAHLLNVSSERVSAHCWLLSPFTADENWRGIKCNSLVGVLVNLIRNYLFKTNRCICASFKTIAVFSTYCYCLCKYSFDALSNLSLYFVMLTAYNHIRRMWISKYTVCSLAWTTWGR